VKKPPGKSGRQGPAPSEDDAVWKYTAASIEPLKRGKPRVRLGDRAMPDTPKTKTPPKRHIEEPRAETKHKAVEPSQTVRAVSSRRPAPELSEFDRKNARKIRGGRIEIEARVDLHGLRQSEAHATLRSFLFRCQSRGLRFVLVITGKGKTVAASEGPYGGYESERGVLKRNVPRWLEEPDVRSIVVSYTTAAIQHGGEGAIYIHLRVRNRS
jgi:DNA-nicking Smr family endonuclease